MYIRCDYRLHSSTDALAKCLRCKRKKIKCDRADPVCRQCVTAAEECQYVERRKRPRVAQQKNVMEYLSQRLEQLEKHVSTSGEPDSSPGSLPTPQREVSQRTPPLSSPEAPLTLADSQESWVIESDHNTSITTVADGDRFIDLLLTRAGASKTKPLRSTPQDQA